MRSLNVLSLCELLRKKENIKKSLERTLKDLTKFVNTEEDFFYLRNQKSLSRLESNYTRHKNGVYKIN